MTVFNDGFIMKRWSHSIYCPNWGCAYCNLQCKYLFSIENRSFQGQFQHYLCIFNRKFENKWHLYCNLQYGNTSNPRHNLICREISDGLLSDTSDLSLRNSTPGVRFDINMMIQWKMMILLQKK